MKKNKKTPQSQELKIYSAKLIFTKKKNGQVSEMVRVTIRYGKKGPTRKKDLPIPDYIDIDELNWTRYKGRPISVYHRTSNGQNYDYVDNRGITVFISLGQRLEDLVNKVCFGNSEQK